MCQDREIAPVMTDVAAEVQQKAQELSALAEQLRQLVQPFQPEAKD